MRIALVLAAASALTLAGSSSAEAKVWFQDIQGRVMRWDQRVTSTILGCPGNPSCRAAVRGTRVYLRRGASTRRSRHGLRLVGRVSASGELIFRVPHVTAGRYHLVARLLVGQDRRLIPASGTFRVARPHLASAALVSGSGL